MDVKDFLNDFGKKVTEVAEVVVDKTSQGVEVQKVKSQKRTQERRVSKDLESLGNIIYERFAAGEIVDDEFMDLCKDIQDSKEMIRNLEDQIDDIKG